eukprot:g4727.t1
MTSVNRQCRKRKRKRIPWSTEETAAVMNGFIEFGHCWKKIKDTSGEILSSRYPDDLRQRYRVLMRLAMSPEEKRKHLREKGLWDDTCEGLFMKLVAKWKELRQRDGQNYLSDGASSNSDMNSVPSAPVLQFPVHRIAEYMRRRKVANRMAGGAPVYMSAILQYVTRTLVEGAHKETNEGKENGSKRTIEPEHILNAFKNDQKLNEFLETIENSEEESKCNNWNNCQFDIAKIMKEMKEIIEEEEEGEEEEKNDKSETQRRTIGNGAPIYLSACLQYLARQLIDQAKLESQKKSVTSGDSDKILPEHVESALLNNVHLKDLVKNIS